MEQRADISPEMNESSENRQERLAQLSGDAFLQEAWGIEKRQQMSSNPSLQDIRAAALCFTANIFERRKWGKCYPMEML